MHTFFNCCQQHPLKICIQVQAVQQCSVHENARNKVAFKSTGFFVHFADFANVQLLSNKHGGSLSLSVVKHVIVLVLILCGKVPDFALLGCVVNDNKVSDLHVICVSTIERSRTVLSKEGSLALETTTVTLMPYFSIRKNPIIACMSKLATAFLGLLENYFHYQLLF